MVIEPAVVSCDSSAQRLPQQLHGKALRSARNLLDQPAGHTKGMLLHAEYAQGGCIADAEGGAQPLALYSCPIGPTCVARSRHQLVGFNQALTFDSVWQVSPLICCATEGICTESVTDMLCWQEQCLPCTPCSAKPWHGMLLAPDNRARRPLAAVYSMVELGGWHGMLLLVLLWCRFSP